MIVVSEDLELNIVNALLDGHMPPSGVSEEEAKVFSKAGRAMLQAGGALLETVAPPLDRHAVKTYASDILGADPGELVLYLKKLSRAGKGREASELLRVIRDRQILSDLINEAGKQLTGGSMDRTSLLAKIDRAGTRSELKPVAEQVGETLPPPPSGITIPGLPAISQASGGVFGMWAIGGEPGLGKSTLAGQIALAVQKVMPVLYYDFENGPEVLLHHYGQVFGSVGALKAGMHQFYLRGSIRTLEADLTTIKPPALVVIDSVQKLPTTAEHRRTSLDRWIHRLEALKQRGYHVLILSEKSRETYGEATMSGFKETGEVEYSADFGAQMIGEQGQPVEFHVVKNRHRGIFGHVCDLTRTENVWQFRERNAVSLDALGPVEYQDLN